MYPHAFVSYLFEDFVATVDRDIAVSNNLSCFLSESFSIDFDSDIGHLLAYFDC